jgi:hypothetical protein
LQKKKKKNIFLKKRTTQIIFKSTKRGFIESTEKEFDHCTEFGRYEMRSLSWEETFLKTSGKCEVFQRFYFTV